jgi:hypothetical protein
MKKTLPLIVLLISLILLPLIHAEDVSKYEAQQTIKEASDLIFEMENEGLSIIAVKDLLKEAEIAYERAEFAELIKKNITGSLAEEARKSLEGLNYVAFNYTDVLIYTKQIKEKRDTAFELYDHLSALEIKKNEYLSLNVDITLAEELLIQANEEFILERYQQTSELIEQIDNELELRRAEQTTLRVIVSSGKNFFIKYWWEILIVLLILGIIIGFSWRKFIIKRLRSRIHHLKTEKESLKELIKKTQFQRFKEGSIPGMVYNVRIEKYSERLDEINHTLPVKKAELQRKLRREKETRSFFQFNKKKKITKKNR